MRFTRHLQAKLVPLLKMVGICSINVCELGESSPNFDSLLANLHTLKGNARTLSYTKLARLVHESEQNVIDSRPETSVAKEQIDNVEMLFKIYESITNEQFKKDNQVEERLSQESYEK